MTDFSEGKAGLAWCMGRHASATVGIPHDARSPPHLDLKRKKFDADMGTRFYLPGGIHETGIGSSEFKRRRKRSALLKTGCIDTLRSFRSWYVLDEASVSASEGLKSSSGNALDVNKLIDCCTA